VADNIFIPDEGLVEKITKLKEQLFEYLTVHLYQNDKVPAAADTAADYTPATFSGYAAQNMSGWGVPSIAGGVAQVAPGTYSWTHSGGAVANTIYGWYATSLEGKLIMVSRRGAGPVTLNGAGQTYSVDVIATDQRAVVAVA